jgi:hypothetical protein
VTEIMVPPEREEGPDPNQVRRHAKRMLTNVEYLKKYRRIGYYRPPEAAPISQSAAARDCEPGG